MPFPAVRRSLPNPWRLAARGYPPLREVIRRFQPIGLTLTRTAPCSSVEVDVVRSGLQRSHDELVQAVVLGSLLLGDVSSLDGC